MRAPLAHRCAAALAALALSACVPTEFEDLRDTGQVVALLKPESFPNARFGAVVAGYGGSVRGTNASRVAFTAGPDTPISVFAVLIGETVRLETPVLDGCDHETEARCDAGAGTALVGFPAWREREVCAVTFATGPGTMHLRCEDNPTTAITVPGPGGERYGASAAALRVVHPFGRAVVGAPGGAAVYRVPDGGGPEALDLSLGAGVGGELGTAVAVGVVDADTVLVAGAAPVGPSGRVVVATSDVAGDGTVTTSVRGCLDSTSPGWGGALAIGDLDGDGALDVVVGSAAEDGRLDAVRVYSGAAMPAPDTCDASWPVALELACPSVEDVDCAGAGFGSALTIGDVDADGRAELIVGAPGAEVEGVSGAGVAFVFVGGELGSLGSTERVEVLRHPRPAEDAELGHAVGVAPGLDGRDEVVVGAPGANRAYVFLCTGVEGDTEASTAGDRCQPRAN